MCTLHLHRGLHGEIGPLLITQLHRRALKLVRGKCDPKANMLSLQTLCSPLTPFYVKGVSLRYHMLGELKPEEPKGQ